MNLAKDDYDALVKRQQQIQKGDFYTIIKDNDSTKKYIEQISGTFSEGETIDTGNIALDAIISTNAEHIETFMMLVDSADVFANCSTRFADGFRFGFGAEVGIATGKIHARGPMGMEGLCTYKYRLYGHGETVAELSNGTLQLTHAPLDMKLPK